MFSTRIRRLFANLLHWSKTTKDSDPVKRPVLVFIHLPRVGGTTLASIIDRKVSGAFSYWFESALFTWLAETSYLQKFLTLPQEERDHFDALYGHMAMDIHQILSRPCAYITVLRDPLKRRISSYYNEVSDKRTYFHETIQSGELTLEEYLEKGAGNDMTRRILGFDLFDEGWDWRRLDEMKASGTEPELRKQIERAWSKPITPEMTEQAKATLRDQFMLVGITERFSDFVFLLAKKLGWASMPHVPMRNQTARLQPPVTLSPEIVDRFRERNSADWVLYNYAKQLFERQWSELSTSENLRARFYRSLKPTHHPTETPLYRWPAATEDNRAERYPNLAFIHIPRTGGTTLASIIKQKVGRNSSYGLESVLFTWIAGESKLQQFLVLPPEERTKFSVLYGHMPIGIHHILPTRPYAYITMLRDPLKHRIASYYNAASDKRTYFHEAIQSGELALEEYLEKGASNDMTRRILGFDLFDEGWDWWRLDEMKASGTEPELRKQIERAWSKPITPEMTEQAKAILQAQFMLVGITERFSDFVLLLAKKLGWRPIPQVPTVNQGASLHPSATLPSELVERFSETNSADYELYAYAKQLFEQQWST